MLNALSLLQSEDNSIREEAQNYILRELENVESVSELFNILQQGNNSYSVAICAAGAIRIWFRSHWTQILPDQKIHYIYNLQSLFFNCSEIHKYLKSLYKSVRAVSVEYVEIFDQYMLQIIPLISTDQPIKIIAEALSIINITILCSSSNLQKKLSLTEGIVNDLISRLIFIITSYDLLSDSYGCASIRYALKIMIIFIFRVTIPSEVLYQCLEMIRTILSSFVIPAERNYYLLIRFCGKFFNRIFKKVSEDYPDMLPSIPDIAIGFVSVLAIDEIPRPTLCQFLSVLYYNSNSLPATSEFAQILIRAAQLTSNDYNDFAFNKELFYEFAYNTKQRSDDSCRHYVSKIVDLMSMRQPRILQILLNFEPCESLMFIISTEFCQIQGNDLDYSLKTFISRCLEKEQNDEMEISTLLLLLSKSAEVFENEELSKIYEIANHFLDCENILIQTNALRIIHKLVKMDVIFPVELFSRMVEIVPVCPNDSASRIINLFILKKPELIQNDAEKLFSSVFMGLLRDIMEVKEGTQLMTYAKNRNIMNSVVILTKIIELFGEVFVSEDLVDLVSLMYSQEEPEYFECITLIVTQIIESKSELTIPLLIKCINLMGNSKINLVSMEYMHVPLVYFISFYTDEFLEMDISNQIITMGIELLNSQQSLQAASTLISWVIQVDQRINANEIVQIFNNNYNMICEIYLFHVIASIYAVNMIQKISPELLESWLMIDLKDYICPFEKHVTAMALINIIGAEPEYAEVLLPVAEELIRLEIKQIRENMKNKYYDCLHNIPAPIFRIPLTHFAEVILGMVSSPQKEELEILFEEWQEATNLLQ